MRIGRNPRGRMSVCLVAVLLLGRCALGAPGEPGGRLSVIRGCKVLEVAGTPEQRGEQHGRLLREEVRRMVRDLITEGEGAWGYDSLIEGTRVMERHLEDDFRRELQALAAAADVPYMDLAAAQLFGDVRRGMYCTSYAVYGPATADGACIVGRNMDYWDHGVSEYGAILLHVTPDNGIPFVTVTWAGIINGWTAMNHRGIVTANNSGYGGTSNSLEGLSTCFMLRKIAQFASSVDEGIDIIRTTPRAVGTNMIIAGGTPPDAAIVEFDHENIAVRKAQDGVILAANDFRVLYAPREEGVAAGDAPGEGLPPPGGVGSWATASRYGILARLIGENHGRITRDMNFAAAPGVPIESMNLHSVLLFPSDLSFRVAMGRIPAFREPYHAFRIGPEGVAAADPE